MYSFKANTHFSDSKITFRVIGLFFCWKAKKVGSDTNIAPESEKQVR
jgi:hypothetical protein